MSSAYQSLLTYLRGMELTIFEAAYSISPLEDLLPVLNQSSGNSLGLRPRACEYFEALIQARLALIEPIGSSTGQIPHSLDLLIGLRFETSSQLMFPFT